MKKLYFDRTEWRNDKGELHREGGPAVEYKNGTKYWHKNEKIHRLDGPAIEHFDGTRKWLIEDLFHRLDGPAIEWNNGNKEWWIEGEKYLEEEWFEMLTEEQKLNYLLKNG